MSDYIHKIELKILVTVVLSLFLLIFCENKEKEVLTQIESPFEKNITFVFAGDIMSHIPQVRAAYLPESNKYDFAPCFEFVRAYIEHADLAVVNLEAPLAGKPYTGYPLFSAPDELAYAAIDAGFDVLLTANNHTADKGRRGLNRTIDVISQRAFHTGSFLDQAQRDSTYPLMLDVRGMQTAILNCTYSLNGNMLPQPSIVNMIDVEQIAADIATAKRRGAQFLIMCIHWGNEYERSPNSEQKELAQWMANEGIDLIIGSHPHVVQDFDLLKCVDGRIVPVYYSLGNLLSNQRERYKNGGIIAKITVDAKSKKIHACNYYPFYLHKGVWNKKLQYYLLPTYDYGEAALKIKLNAADQQQVRLFESDTEKLLDNLPFVF